MRGKCLPTEPHPCGQGLLAFKVYFIYLYTYITALQYCLSQAAGELQKVENDESEFDRKA